MSLVSFEIKLKEIEFKLEKVREAFKYNTETVLHGLKTLELNDPNRNIFAQHDFTLKESLYRIRNVINELNVYYKHREIIESKVDRVKMALVLLDKLEDDVIDLLASLQAMVIFLENLRKEK